MEKRKCPKCGNESRFYHDYETGEIVCAECGAVIESIQLLGPEWRVFEPEDFTEKRRTGPIDKATKVKGPETVMDRGYRDAHGKKLSLLQRIEAGRTRRVEMKSPAYHEQKHLKYAMGVIQKYVYELNLPDDIAETAATWYKKLREEGIMRGRSIEAIVAALIYLAVLNRDPPIPLSLDEIAKVMGLQKKEIDRMRRFIQRKLGLKAKVLSPEDYIIKLVNELQLGADVLRFSQAILEEARKKGLVGGRSPTGLAAAIVYIASKELNVKKTQKDIAEKANITEVTIRNRYRELQEKLDIQKIKETLFGKK